QPQVAIIGLDANPLRLRAARATLEEYSLGENITLITGDADNLTFASNCFDSVMSARLLQYVSDPVETVMEMTRVLKPGGRLVVTVPNLLNPIRYVTYGKVLYSPTTVREWFSNNGLTQISCRSI